MMNAKMLSEGEIPLRRRAIVTGNFDGCHLGHRALFNTLKERAAEKGLDPLVVSFTPHTHLFLSPHSPYKLLTSDQEKRELLMKYYQLPLLLLPFNQQLREMSREEYLQKIVREKLGASYWLMGANHRFGLGGAGDFQTITTVAHFVGVELERLELVESGAEVVSSSRIRSLISEGRMQEVKELLGYSYRVSGVVGPGAKRGREIGFPTANVTWEHPEKQLPPDGVLAGWVHLRGEKHAAVAFLGSNLTFGESQRRLEVHLLDWAGDLYGERLVFSIAGWLRRTVAFSSADELKNQIQRDIVQAKQFLFPK